MLAVLAACHSCRCQPFTYHALENGVKQEQKETVEESGSDATEPAVKQEPGLANGGPQPALNGLSPGH